MNIDFLFILFKYLLFTYLPDNLNHVSLPLPKNFISLFCAQIVLTIPVKEIW